MAFEVKGLLTLVVVASVYILPCESLNHDIKENYTQCWDSTVILSSWVWDCDCDCKSCEDELVCSVLGYNSKSQQNSLHDGVQKVIGKVDGIGIKSKQLGRVSRRTGNLSIKAQELNRALEAIRDTQRYRGMNEGD
ncbi:uncharacterized protein LOC127715123 [Mytilus californianus]|uniref:uncharacterized protein LOC127715123 n=1 Tax=Mytilus californianus TaxID=6549 RepID=UPI002247D4C7|nr:uncharacterized protein LOC127715123 [Mytilus californianus]